MVCCQGTNRSPRKIRCEWLPLEHKLQKRTVKIHVHAQRITHPHFIAQPAAALSWKYLNSFAVIVNIILLPHCFSIWMSSSPPSHTFHSIRSFKAQTFQQHFHCRTAHSTSALTQWQNVGAQLICKVSSLNSIAIWFSVRFVKNKEFLTQSAYNFEFDFECFVVNF